MKESTVHKHIKKYSLGNKKDEKALIKFFISEMTKRVERLEKGMEEDDWKNIEFNLYNVMSSFTFLGLNKPVQLAREILSRIKRNHKTIAKNLIIELNRICMKEVRCFLKWKKSPS